MIKKHKRQMVVSARLHYTTVLILLLSNLALFALAIFLDFALLGKGLGYFVELREITRLQTPVVHADATYAHSVSLSYANIFQSVKSVGVIAIHPSDPNIIYNGTWGGGVIKSVDGGRTWGFKNDGLPSLFIGDLAFDPQTPSTMYAAIVGHVSSNGGTLYKTTNGGDYWVPVPGVLGGGTPFNVNPCAWTEQVTVDPTNSNRLYFGMAINNCNVLSKSCGGMYHSADGGATFEPNPGCSASRPRAAGDYFSNDVVLLRLNPARSNEVYYGPGWVHPEEEALGTSYDYGTTNHYSDVVDTRDSFMSAGQQYLSNLFPTFLELSPVDPDVRFAVHGDRFSVMRRSDGVLDPMHSGSLWSIPIPPVVVRYNGDKSQSVVDGVDDNDADGEDTPDNIWKPVFSIDSLPASPTGLTGYTVDALVLAPNDEKKLYITTHISPFAGADGAAIWELAEKQDATQEWGYRKIYEVRNTNSGTSPTITNLKISNANPYKIYFTEDERRTQSAGQPLPVRFKVLESTDQGAAWSATTLSSLSPNLHANEINEFTAVSGGRDIFISSTQGLYKLDESQIQDSWAARSFGGSSPQGSTFTTVTQDPKDKSLFFTKGPRNVSISINNGDVFWPIDEISFGLGGGYPNYCPYDYSAPILTTAVFNALAADPTNVHTIYAGSDVGLWMNAKAGGFDGTTCTGAQSYSNVTQAWQHIVTSGLGDSYLWSLVFDPGDDAGNTMWAGTRTGVYKSIDRGVTWSEKLPNIRDARRVVISGDTIIVPTLSGVYRSSDHGVSWNKVLATPATDVSKRLGHAGQWMVATKTGLMKSGDDGATWSAFETAFTGPVETVLYTSSRTGNARAYYSGSGDGIYMTDYILAPDTIAPSVPDGLVTSAVTDSKVSLAWNATQDNSGGSGIAGYNVLRSDSQSGPLTKLTASVATTYDDPTVHASSTYFYAVQAYDVAGNTSQNSAALQVATAPDTTRPTMLLVNVVALSPIKIHYSWATATDNSGIAGYQLHGYYTKVGVGRVDIELPFITETSYDWAPLQPNTYYVFSVKARDLFGLESNYSTRVFKTPTLASDTTAPSITVVQQSSVGSTGVTIGWTTNEDSSTQVEYGTSPTYGSTSALDTSWVLNHSAVLTGLTPGITYYYRVMSADISGNKSVSSDASFTTPSQGSATTSSPSGQNAGGGTTEPVGNATTSPSASSAPIPPTSNSSAGAVSPSASQNQIESFVAQEYALVKKVNASLTNRLSGSILLQVEDHGEAWYLYPVTKLRYYLANGTTAYGLLRRFGLGVSTADLAKIPVGIERRFQDKDTDGDGLPDTMEEGIGTNPLKADTDGDGYPDGAEVLSGYDPLSSAKLVFNANLTNRLKGRIVLQVQAKGQAWYINPKDGKRYYMKNGEAAYQIMRYLSLGILDRDLRMIAVGQ